MASPRDSGESSSIIGVVGIECDVMKSLIKLLKLVSSKMYWMTSIRYL